MLVGASGRGDQIDAAEEFPKAGAGDLVVATDAPFLADEQACLFHDGKMFGEGRDIASGERGQLVHTKLTVSQAFHDEKSRRVSHRFHHDRTICGVLLERYGAGWHIWQKCQINGQCQDREFSVRLLVTAA